MIWQLRSQVPKRRVIKFGWNTAPAAPFCCRPKALKTKSNVAKSTDSAGSCCSRAACSAVGWSRPLVMSSTANETTNKNHRKTCAKGTEGNARHRPQRYSSCSLKMVGPSWKLYIVETDLLVNWFNSGSVHSLS